MTPEKFKEIRLKLGFNQEEMAEVLCLANNKVVSNIEAGFRKPSKLTAVIMSYLNELTQRRAEEFVKELKFHSDKEEKSLKRGNK